jgi:hypothetical protein
MVSVVVMKNDIKNYLNRNNEEYYEIDNNSDIEIVYNLFVNGSSLINHDVETPKSRIELTPSVDIQKLSPFNKNSAIVNYYHGVYLECNKHKLCLSYYIESAQQNNLMAIEKLVKCYGKNAQYENYMECCIYKLILNEAKYNWLSIWANVEYMLLCYELSVTSLTDNALTGVYRNVGNYYLKQHNYDLMTKYYKYADDIQNTIKINENLRLLFERTEENNKMLGYALAKKFNTDPNVLNDVEKYYNVKQESTSKNGPKCGCGKTH